MQIEPRFTAMSAALFKAAYSITGHPVTAQVTSAIRRNQGLLKVRGWNATLSFKTAQKLKQQGVL